MMEIKEEKKLQRSPFAKLLLEDQVCGEAVLPRNDREMLLVIPQQYGYNKV